VVEDIALEQVVCSEGCRRQAMSVQGTGAVPSDAELRDGRAHPIARGFRLWRRALLPLAAEAALPVALAAAAMAGLHSWWIHLWPDDSLLVVVPPIFLVAVSLALISVVLSRQLTGVGAGSLYVWALRRILPWLVTWALVIGAVIAGYMLFVLPGIYVSLRLFWADEYALVHDCGPLRAISASWRLSNGVTGEIFRFQFVLGFAQLAVWMPAVVIMAFAFNIADGFGSANLVADAVSAFIAAAVLVTCYGFSHACELCFFYGLRAGGLENGSEHEPEQGIPGDRRVSIPVNARDRQGRPLCPHCGHPYDLADYRPDATILLCSACKGVLPGDGG
jgi:hypothetical protein